MRYIKERIYTVSENYFHKLHYDFNTRKQYNDRINNILKDILNLINKTKNHYFPTGRTRISYN